MTNPKLFFSFLNVGVCVFAGDPVLHLCPVAHYCDGLPGSDFNGGTGPRPCPLYTYRDSPGAGSKGDCLPCPPGSHCNSTGLTYCTPRNRLQPLIKNINLTHMSQIPSFSITGDFFSILIHSFTTSCACSIMKCKVHLGSPLSGGLNLHL